MKRRDNLIQFIYYTFDNIRMNILPILGLIIAAIGSSNRFVPIIKVAFYILIAFIIIYSFLKWYNKIFEFDDKMIKISEGVYKKIYNDIPLSKVKSINTSDSILKRLFDISDLSVELIGGSNTVFVLKNKDIIHLKSHLFRGTNEVIEKKEKKYFSLFEYWLLSFLNLKLYISALSICSTTFLLLGKQIISEENKKNDKNIIELLIEVKEAINEPNFVITFFFVIIILIISSHIIVLGYTILIFGNFNIVSSKTNIRVWYGIKNKREYFIPSNQIRSLLIVEPLLLRIFGYVQIKIETIGLDNSHSSTVVLTPVIKKVKIHDFLKENLPEFIIQDFMLKPEKKFLVHFIVLSSYKLFLFVLLVTLLLNFKFLILLIFLPICIIYGYMQWKYSALAYNERYISNRRANKLKIITMVTLKKYTQTTGISQSYFMRNTNVIHYDFSLYSEEIEDIYICRYLKDTYKKEFLDYLIYNNPNN